MRKLSKFLDDFVMGDHDEKLTLMMEHHFYDSDIAEIDWIPRHQMPRDYSWKWK